MISDEAIDLIKKMLVRNPIERISAENVGKHAWFVSGTGMAKSKGK